MGFGVFCTYNLWLLHRNQWQCAPSWNNGRPKSVHLQIVLDEPSRVYFTDQKLSGKVRLTTQKRIQAKGLKVKLEGEASAHWKDLKGSNYDSSKKIVNYEDPLVVAGDDQLKLNAGCYEYSFEYEVQGHWLTSIECVDGQVRYRLKATLDFGRWRKKEKAKMAFTINRICDMNTLTSYLRPFEAKQERRGSVKCVQLKGSVQRTAWVPGETIVFDGSAQILGGGHLQRTSLTFFQKITIHHKDAATYNRLILHRAVRNEPPQLDKWEQVAIRIPAVPPTDLNDFVDIQYFIKFEANLVLGRRRVKLVIPVTICNVPLLKMLKGFEPAREPLRSPLVISKSADGGSLEHIVPCWIEGAFGMQPSYKKQTPDCWPRYATYKAIENKF